MWGNFFSGKGVLYSERHRDAGDKSASETLRELGYRKVLNSRSSDILLKRILLGYLLHK
jgi:hypothetical protein